MHQSEATRQRVEQLTVDQRRLVKHWKSQRYDVTSTVGERLRTVLESAIALPSYAALYKEIELPRLLAETPAGEYVRILDELPLITKADAHRIGDDVLRLRRSSLLNYFETSGTTGVPTPTPKSLDEIVVNTVNFGESWAEIFTPDDRALILINTPQGPAAYQFERVFNYLGIQTFRTWVDTIRNDYGRVLEIIDRFEPTVWAGPPSQLINLYEHACRSHSRPPRFARVLLTGEPAGTALKRRLGELSGGAVFDGSYGSSETGTTAVAWAGPGLRLQTQSYVFELFARDGVELIAPGCSGTGELVVTSLQNLNRPLIRYRTGDLVTITAQDDGAQILTPHGRVTDQVHLGDLRFTQNELEDTLWPERDPGVVFNYLLAYDGTRTDMIVTADQSGPASVHGSLSRIAERLPGVAIHVVRQLPAVNSLGSAMGWKATRILDLRDTARGDFSGPIAEAVRESQQFVRSLTGTGL